MISPSHASMKTGVNDDDTVTFNVNNSMTSSLFSKIIIFFDWHHNMNINVNNNNKHIN